jgi:hypothetical protein
MPYVKYLRSATIQNMYTLLTSTGIRNEESYTRYNRRAVIVLISHSASSI